jgi:hypothetical protein
MAFGSELMCCDVDVDANGMLRMGLLWLAMLKNRRHCNYLIFVERDE